MPALVVDELCRLLDLFEIYILWCSSAEWLDAQFDVSGRSDGAF